MASRPRQSVLKLFDPLSTPTKSTSSGSSKENATPKYTRPPNKDESVSETLFFKRTYSRSKVHQGNPPVPPLPVAFSFGTHLVDVEGLTQSTEVGMDIDQGATRKPLLEITALQCDSNIPETVSPPEVEPSTLSSVVEEEHASTSEGTLQRPDMPEDYQHTEDISAAMQASVTMGEVPGSPTVMLAARRSHEDLEPPSQTLATSAATPVGTTPLTSWTQSNISGGQPSTESSRPICFFLPGQQGPASPQGFNTDTVAHTPKPAKSLAIRRSSFDLKNQWKSKAQDASTNLLNDDMSFLVGMDESSYLNSSREEQYISRFGGHVVRGECAELDVSAAEVTPDTSSNSEKTIADGAEGNGSTRTPSPNVLGKRSTSSRSPSPTPETPKSSPISASVRAPTKKEKAFRVKTAVGQNYETSKERANPAVTVAAVATTTMITAPVNTGLAKIQPLAIKKKHTDTALISSHPSEPGNSKRPQLAKSTPATSVGSTVAISRSASTSSASTTVSTSAKPSLPPGRGGARRVPLNSSAVAPFTKPNNPQASAPARKGPQRPPVPIPLLSSGHSDSSNGPTLGLKPGIARPTLPSVSAPSGSNAISRLPKPQIKSRIPGPSVGLRRKF